MSDTPEAPALNGRRARCFYYGGGGFRSYACNYRTQNPDCSPKRCTCELPSDPSLPFFEYRGPGSRYAVTICRRCGYHEEAHPRDLDLCPGFEPIGPAHDTFLCGCAGWD